MGSLLALRCLYDDPSIGRSITRDQVAEMVYSHAKVITLRQNELTALECDLKSVPFHTIVPAMSVGYQLEESDKVYVTKEAEDWFKMDMDTFMHGEEATLSLYALEQLVDTLKARAFRI